MKFISLALISLLIQSNSYEFDKSDLTIKIECPKSFTRFDDEKNLRIKIRNVRDHNVELPSVLHQGFYGDPIGEVYLEVTRQIFDGDFKSCQKTGDIIYDNFQPKTIVTLPPGDTIGYIAYIGLLHDLSLAGNYRVRAFIRFNRYEKKEIATKWHQFTIH